MKRTLLQISSSLILLILMLMIPMVIKSSIGGKSLSFKESISHEAATTIVNAADKSSDSGDIQKTSSKALIKRADLQKYALYSLSLLFIISTVSFLKFKVLKDIHDQE